MVNGVMQGFGVLYPGQVAKQRAGFFLNGELTNPDFHFDFKENKNHWDWNVFSFLVDNGIEVQIGKDEDLI